LIFTIRFMDVTGHTDYTDFLPHRGDKGTGARKGKGRRRSVTPEPMRAHDLRTKCRDAVGYPYDTKGNRGFWKEQGSRLACVREWQRLHHGRLAPDRVWSGTWASWGPDDAGLSAAPIDGDGDGEDEFTALLRVVWGRLAPFGWSARRAVLPPREQMQFLAKRRRFGRLVRLRVVFFDGHSLPKDVVFQTPMAAAGAVPWYQGLHEVVTAYVLWVADDRDVDLCSAVPAFVMQPPPGCGRSFECQNLGHEYHAPVTYRDLVSQYGALAVRIVRGREQRVVNRRRRLDGFDKAGTADDVGLIDEEPCIACRC
jgi:hypothetical protein